MENVALINQKDLEQVLKQLNTIHQFIVKSDIKPARRLRSEWLSSNEATQVLQCSMRTLQNYINEGLLPRRIQKRRLYFTTEDIENFLQGKHR